MTTDICLRLLNPFSCGGTYSKIEVYRYDSYEWYWKDDIGQCCGPYNTRQIAIDDAVQTYNQQYAMTLSTRYNLITRASQAFYKAQLASVKTEVKTEAKPDLVYLVAIVLDENDYYPTAHNLLETVWRALRWKPITSQEYIKLLIEQGIKFHYLAFQAAEKVFEPEADEKSEYLLKKVRVLFNEEAQKDIDTKDHNHTAWFLVTHTGKICSY